MDSSSSSITSVGDATEALKSLLKVGKPPMTDTPSDTPTASLQDDLQKFLSMQSLSSDENRASQISNLSNGQLLLQDFLKNMSQQKETITQQQILLQGSDMQNSFSVYGRDVDIISSKASGSITPSSGSNKVQINPVVNFDWEHKMYTGQLVAVHRNCIHVAYVLRGKSGGIVRVINRKTAERALLKGFQGKVMDISFAHLTTVVIGAVDEVGNMFVYEIHENMDGKMDTVPVLSVMRPSGTPLSDYHRLVWCPYIPEEEEASSATVTTDSSTEDASKLLVLTHGSVAEMWNVDHVTEKFGPGPLLPSEVDDGFIIIDSHTQPVFDACFSPDGTALATASLDGDVKFFQVNMTDHEDPKCLFQWKPHDGKPVTSLFFLDDHKNPNPDVQFWKFAITGADKNREVKIWSCESWTCLQSLYFRPPPDLPSNFSVDPCLKLSMDLSANYLVLSDIKRKVLYVMTLFQEREESRAHVSSVSEFLLTQPCLSMAILDVGVKKFKKSELKNGLDGITTDVNDEDEDLLDDGETAEEQESAVVLRLFSVHTKALQELCVRFQPDASTPQPPPASMSSFGPEEGCRDLMSDISMDTVASETGQVAMHSHTRSFDGQEPALGKPPSQPTLMTPDSFTTSYSPRKEAREAVAAMDSARSSTTVQSNISGMSSLTQVTGMDEDALRSGRGSLFNSQNVASPQSSVTLTPASSKDLSVGSHMETPTQIPLPPPTPGEENALASPPSLRQPPPASQLPHPLLPSEMVSTPPHASRSLDHLPGASNASMSHEFLTSSPATRFSREEFKPPHVSHSESSKASDLDEQHSDQNNQSAQRGDVDDFFSNAEAQRPKLSSAESSSSTSLEVKEIMEGSTKKPENYISGSMEEEEEEGEQVGEQEVNRDIEKIQQNGESEGQTQRSEATKSNSSQEDQSEDEIEEEIEVDEGSGNDTDRSSNMFQSGTSWPKPPAVPAPFHEVDVEAQRLATEALHRASSYTGVDSDSKQPPPQVAPQHPEVGQRQELNGDESAGNLHRSHTYTIKNDSSSVQLYAEQADDDVCVEEEMVEESSPSKQIHLTDRQSSESGSFSAHNLTKDTSDERPQKKQESSEMDSLSYSSTYSSPSRGILVADNSYRYLAVAERTSNVVVAPVDSTNNDIASREPAYIYPSIDTTRIEQLQSSVQQMLSLLQTQQREIEHLRIELNQHRGDDHRLEGLQSQIDSLDNLLTSKVSETLTQHSVTENERLHLVLGQRDVHEKQKHDALITQLTQTLERTISHKMERVVKDEIRNHVVPKVEEILEPVTAQLHKEVAHKLTATDQLVKDNIAKLIRSRQTVEAMGTAAGNALQGPVQSACRDVLIPSFDKACQNMFQQIQGGFQRGTQDYIKHLDGHLEQVRQRHDESRDPIIHQLQAMVESFHGREQANERVYSQLQSVLGTVQSQMDQSQAAEGRMEAQIKHAVSGVQDAVISEVKKLIQEEVMGAMRDQQTSLSTQLIEAMRQGMMTPVSPLTPDPEQLKSQVLQLLRQGQLNSAFQQALSASDLDLVLFVCDTVNPSQVFNQIPCPLQQPVLLSLIQQLSADLTTHVDLKHQYLQEAVMNLDQSNVITKEHMPAVLGQLCQKLLSHTQAHPQDRSTRSLKMLLMASQSLLK